MAHIKAQVVLSVRRRVDNLTLEVKTAYFNGVSTSVRHHGIGKSGLPSLFTSFQDVMSPISYVAHRMIKRQNKKYNRELRTNEP